MKFFLPNIYYGNSSDGALVDSFEKEVDEFITSQVDSTAEGIEQSFGDIGKGADWPGLFLAFTAIYGAGHFLSQGWEGWLKTARGLSTMLDSLRTKYRVIPFDEEAAKLAFIIAYLKTGASNPIRIRSVQYINQRHQYVGGENVFEEGVVGYFFICDSEQGAFIFKADADIETIELSAEYRWN
jgi:hypothetical protein